MKETEFLAIAADFPLVGVKEAGHLPLLIVVDLVKFEIVIEVAVMVATYSMNLHVL